MRSTVKNFNNPRRNEMNNTVKLLLKSLKGVYVFEAALTVAQSEWLMKKPSGLQTDRDKAEWIENRAIDIVGELKAELSS
jgi:hypothetical protein